MLQRHLQQAVIALADALETHLEPTLEKHQRIATACAAFTRHMGFEQVVGHGRYQGPRQDERSDHGEDHRQGHRHEQETRHPFEEEHRHEHNADTQQRDERRGHDLRGAVHDRVLDGFALFQVPIDVFDGHRGIVHQDPDGQRQPPQGHDVEGFTQG
ncbi:hypothetical protein D3C87_1623990 [compost metagenome]